MFHVFNLTIKLVGPPNLNVKPVTVKKKVERKHKILSRPFENPNMDHALSKPAAPTVFDDVVVALVAASKNPALSFVAFVQKCDKARRYPLPHDCVAMMAATGHEIYNMEQNSPIVFQNTMPPSVICDRRLRNTWKYLRKNLLLMPLRHHDSKSRWRFVAKGILKIIGTRPQDPPQTSDFLSLIDTDDCDEEDFSTLFRDVFAPLPAVEPAAGVVTVARQLIDDPDFDKKHARNAARQKIDYMQRASLELAKHLDLRCEVVAVVGGVVCALAEERVRFALVHPGHMPHDIKPGMPSTCKSGGKKRKRKRSGTQQAPDETTSVFMVTEPRANAELLCDVFENGAAYGSTTDGGLTAFARTCSRTGAQNIYVASPLHRLGLIVDATLVPPPGRAVFVKGLCLIPIEDVLVTGRMSAAGKFPQQQYILVVLTDSGLCLVECWQPKKRSTLPKELAVFPPELLASAIYSPRPGTLCVLGPTGETELSVAFALGERGVISVPTRHSTAAAPKRTPALPCYTSVCPVTGSACTLHFGCESAGPESPGDVWGNLTWVFPEAATWTISLRGVGKFSRHWWALPKKIAGHRTVLGAATDQCHVYILTPGAGVDDVLVRMTATYCTVTGTGTCECVNMTATLFAAPAVLARKPLPAGSLSLVRGRQQGMAAWDVGIPSRVNLGVPVLFTLLAGLPAQQGTGSAVHLVEIAANLVA